MEDPAFLSFGDIADVTALNPRVGARGGTLLVPLGGTLLFNHPEPRATGTDPVTADRILEALLADYRASGLVGEFILRRTGTLYHVIPVATRDASSRPIPYRSVLETKITVSVADRSVLQMVSEIVDAIKTGGAPKVGFGSAPTNLFLQKRYEGGADNEVARDVLSRVLLATRTDLSWRVLCDPGPEKYCVLNIHAVTPGGSGSD